MNDKTKTPADDTKTTVKAEDKTVVEATAKSAPEATKEEPKATETPQSPTAMAAAISTAIKPAPAKREVILDEGDDEIEPGVYPQDDGTVNVVLNTPIKRSSGEPIAVVKVLHMPLVKDMNKAGGRMELLRMMDSAHMIVAPTVTEPTINPKTWESMDIADTTNLMGGILHFFVGTKKSESAQG